MQFLTHLKNLGLSENEAKVYLAMLELGPATVLEISTKAEINRPTAYVQIETLKKKGLVSTQEKGKRQLFVPESPEQLEVLLEKEKKEIEVRKGELQKILPDLTALLDSAGERPLVRYFEGKDGLLKLQSEFLKTKSGVIYGIGSIDDAHVLFPNHQSDYVARRVGKGIKSKFIYTSTKGPFLAEKDQQKLRDSRFISPERMPFTADITIFDDNVAIASLKGKVGGTIITSKEVAESFRALFGVIWDSLV